MRLVHKYLNVGTLERSISSSKIIQAVNYGDDDDDYSRC